MHKMSKALSRRLCHDYEERNIRAIKLLGRCLQSNFPNERHSIKRNEQKSLRVPENTITYRRTIQCKRKTFKDIGGDFQ